jgi:hypothetical protein
MAWKSAFDNGSPQVQGDAQKHEEFEVSVCKMALSHRRPVGTDRHECPSVPTLLKKGEVVSPAPADTNPPFTDHLNLVASYLQDIDERSRFCQN